MTEQFDKYEKRGAYHWAWYRRNTMGYRDLVTATLSYLPRQGRILDVGCGDGLVTYLLFRRGLRAQGVDPNERGVQLGRRAIVRRYQRAHVLQALAWGLTGKDAVAEVARRGCALTVGTVDDLPADERFDYGLCHDVIEHVPNPEALVAGLMARVTQFALFTSPNGLHRKPREYDYQFWTPESFPGLFGGRRVDLIEVTEDRLVAKVHAPSANR